MESLLLSTMARTANYYNMLPVDELKFALPALCEAIVSRSLKNPEPEPEVNPDAMDLEILERSRMTGIKCYESDVEPGLNAFDAAVQFTDEFGSNATVHTSSILAVAWVYLVALSMFENQELRVPVLSVNDFNYGIHRDGILAIIQVQPYTVVTLRNLIYR